MDDLIAQLRRIAESLEAQNRIYVDRCVQADKMNKAEEKRRFQHDFDLVNAHHAPRLEQLHLEHENIKLIQRLYMEHPEHLLMQAASLNKALDELSQPDDATTPEG